MISSTKARLILVAAAALVVSITACRKKDKDTPPENTDDPAVLALDGSETSSVETDNELLTSSLVASSGATLSLASSADLGGGELTSEDLGDGAKLLFFPRGCLNVTHDPSAHTVTYAFKDCTGPNGLFRIAGEVKATYAASSTELVLDLVGSDLKINRAAVDWSAHARIVANGAGRTMEWKAQLSGTTPRGREFRRTNKKTLTWTLGERCIGVAGTAEGDVRGRNLKTEITGYRRCQGACPEAGGQITITNGATGTRIVITFDGSDRAKWTGPNGTTTFALSCNGS